MDHRNSGISRSLSHFIHHSQPQSKKTQMPTKLTVGVCRKKGLADFGSTGANCSLEIELDSNIMESPARFQEQARRAYAAARQAVDEELARHQGEAKTPLPSSTQPSANRRTESKPVATSKQIRAILTIAKKSGVNLSSLITARGADSLEQLSISDASSLIDELKGMIAESSRR